MLTLGPIGFASPWLLAALLAVPLAYFIIRAVPPAPRRMFFPATWLARALKSENVTSQTTPPWLLILRLGMLALVILLLAQPLLNPQRSGPGSALPVLVIDTSWAAAADWDKRRAYAASWAKAGTRSDRQVAILGTTAPIGGWAAQSENGPETAAETRPNSAQVRSSAAADVDSSPDLPADLPAPERLNAEAAQRAITALSPRGYGPDYSAVIKRVAALAEDGPIDITFLGAGINHGGAAEMFSALDATGPTQIVEIAGANLRHIAISAVSLTATGVSAKVIRLKGQPEIAIRLEVIDEQGEVISEGQDVFARNARNLSLDLAVPALLRDRLFALRIVGAGHAAAVYYFDERAQRPLVGIAEQSSNALLQPLETPQYYFQRALQPYSTLARAPLRTLLSGQAGTILVADRARLPLALEDDTLKWVRDGGTLVRFAGPNLTADDRSAADPLLAQPLRPNARTVGGAMSWAQAQTLAPFASNSPFEGIAISPEIEVRKQVLSQMTGAPGVQVWARLTDGTPMVTARTEGRGLIVLFHTSADGQWSNFAFSGTYVEMLQRCVMFNRGGSAGAVGPQDALTLSKIVTGDGRLVPTPQALSPVSADVLLRGGASAARPPGVYLGPRGALAFNLANEGAGPFTPLAKLISADQAIGSLPRKVTDGTRERDLRGPLAALLALLAVVDFVAGLALRGVLTTALPLKSRPKRAAASVIVVLLSAVALGASILTPRAALADPAPDLAADVRLACLASGLADLDALCLNGLNGLSRHLRLRTSVWTGDAQLATLDDPSLGLYPLLYWPVSTRAPDLTSEAADKLTAYLETGGMLVIDMGVGEQGSARFGIDEDLQAKLQDLAAQVSMPSLQILDEEHVLTHSFYILKRFPGRRGDTPVWVETGGAELGAPVSPVVIGNADWASAWATGQTGLPGFASGQDRQSELAIRFGINIVMYALTGTYKADQVHLPALLNRLEQEK